VRPRGSRRSKQGSPRRQMVDPAGWLRLAPAREIGGIPTEISSSQAIASGLPGVCAGPRVRHVVASRHPCWQPGCLPIPTRPQRTARPRVKFRRLPSESGAGSPRCRYRVPTISKHAWRRLWRKAAALPRGLITTGRCCSWWRHGHEPVPHLAEHGRAEIKQQ